MRRIDTITGHADRLRIGPWRGDPTLALLSPTPGAPPSRSGLAHALDELRSQGYASVLTPALSAAEQTVFLDYGFTVHERLHLLRHGLYNPPSGNVDATTLRRGAPAISLLSFMSMGWRSMAFGDSIFKGCLMPDRQPLGPDSEWRGATIALWATTSPVWLADWGTCSALPCTLISMVVELALPLSVMRCVGVDAADVTRCW